MKKTAPLAQFIPPRPAQEHDVQNKCANPECSNVKTGRRSIYKWFCSMGCNPRYVRSEQENLEARIVEYSRACDAVSSALTSKEFSTEEKWRLMEKLASYLASVGVLEFTTVGDVAWAREVEERLRWREG